MHYPKGDKVATRSAFGEAIMTFGGRYKNVVVLDADLAGSLKTGKFTNLYPDRHYNFGIAEANMVNSAAGMSLRGKIPFACSFSVFVTGRAWEHIRNSICYPNLNVKIVGSHAGLMTGEDGATHQALEDIAIMRALPNMKVICPADAVEAYMVIEEVIKDYGPTYIRLGRAGVPVLYDADVHNFRIGYGDILTYGEDIAIVATGSMVHVCVEVAKRLSQDGINSMVVNMASIKPIDEKLIIDAAKKTKMMVTVEDHGTLGGLGGAVCEVTSEHFPVRVHRIGMESFGESGKGPDLYRKFGLDTDGVYERIIGHWQQRPGS